MDRGAWQATVRGVVKESDVTLATKQMWGFSSLTRYWTHVPCVGRWILNHWTTREVQVCIFKKRWRGKHSVLLASQGVTISQHDFGRKEGICQIKVLFLFVLEKEMATHSSLLSWRIPWMEEPGGLQSTGRKESDTTEWLHFHFRWYNRSSQFDVWFLCLI